MKNLLTAILLIGSILGTAPAFGALSAADKGLISAPINPIVNGSFENGKYGYATFADSAASTPENLTGGTANSSIAVTSGGGIAGNSYLTFTKNSGATRQGEGFSADVTIPTSWQGHTLTLRSDFATSAGYTDDTMSVWVYDKTNAGTPTQLSQGSIKGCLLPACPLAATFQAPSNSTSLRIGWYIGSSSNTSAFTLKVFGNLSLSPVVAQYGSPVIDWQPTTGLSINGVGTTTNNSFSYKRIGDFAVVKGSFTAGTVAASTASITLPFSIDSNPTKISSSSQGTKVGWVRMKTSGSNAAMTLGTNIFDLFYNGSDTSKVYVAYRSGGNSYSTDNGSVVFVSSANIDFEFSVPVLGWSSGTQMSSDSAEGREISARAYRTTNQSLTTATVTKIGLTGISYDKTVAFDTTNNYFVVQSPGRFRTHGQITFAANATGRRYAYIAAGTIGSTTTRAQFWLPGSSTDDVTVPVDTTEDLTTGQIIELDGFQDSGGALNVLSGSIKTFLTIEKIQGPNQIAATDSISAFYTSSATTIGTSSATIIFPTKVWDSHGMVDPATGIITCKAPGKIEFSAMAEMGAAVTPGAANVLFIAATLYKNGSLYRGMGVFVAANTSASQQYEMPLGTTTADCVTGDTFELKASRSSSIPSYALSGSATWNWISIKRIGN